jgi:hypothetical protein
MEDALMPLNTGKRKVGNCPERDGFKDLSPLERGSKARASHNGHIRSYEVPFEEIEAL